MIQSDTTISEVKLIYRTKVKASERLWVNCSKGSTIFKILWVQKSHLRATLL
jgi:hypothetical protein